MTSQNDDQLIVGLAQIAPVWLNREATIEKMIAFVDRAARKDCRLVVFGEAMIPGYPFWSERTDGARFNSQIQKDFFAHYVDQAVQPEAGHVGRLQQAAADNSVAVYTGTIERAANRGGHSLYCSMVFIGTDGQIGSVHRKLMPTYEERLNWSPGDGHGLRVHPVGRFTVGGLNCWENWMPLPRAALYAQGEDLHVAIWPGAKRNTQDITRFIAQEARSYVVSVSGILRKTDIPEDVPHRDLLLENCEEMPADGGSCVAGPDGRWIIEPQVGAEGLFVATLDHSKIREERHNFDPAGHYARPDVTKLIVDRTRQSTVGFKD